MEGIIGDLRPSILVEIGLIPALEEYFKVVVDTIKLKVGQGITGWVTTIKQSLILTRVTHPIPEIQQAKVVEQIDSGGKRCHTSMPL